MWVKLTDEANKPVYVNFHNVAYFRRNKVGLTNLVFVTPIKEKMLITVKENELHLLKLIEESAA